MKALNGIQADLCVGGCLRTRVAVLASIVFIAGCSVSRKDVVSPYQEALETYYASAANPSDASVHSAEAAALRAVNGNGRDLEARLLLANVYLLGLRGGFRSEEMVGPALVNELQTVALSLDDEGAAQDWVSSRLYTTAGDYLLLRGIAELKSRDALKETPAGATDSAPGKDRHAAGVPTRNPVEVSLRASQLFAGARLFFLAAVATAKSSKGSVGLRREQTNAREGYVVALNGILRAIWGLSLNPDANCRAVTVRESTLKELAAALSGQEVEGSPLAAGFSATLHSGLYSVNAMLAARAFAKLKQSKAADDSRPSDQEVQELKKLYDEWMARLEESVTHGLVASILGSPDIPPSLPPLFSLAANYLASPLDVARKSKKVQPDGDEVPAREQ